LIPFLVFAVYCFEQTAAETHRRALDMDNLMDARALSKRDSLESSLETSKHGSFRSEKAKAVDPALLENLDFDTLTLPAGLLNKILELLSGIGTLLKLDFDPVKLQLKITIQLISAKSDGLLEGVLDALLNVIDALLGPNGLVNKILDLLLGLGSILKINFNPDSKQLELVIQLLGPTKPGVPVTPIPNPTLPVPPVTPPPVALPTPLPPVLPPTLPPVLPPPTLPSYYYPPSNSYYQNKPLYYGKPTNGY